MCSGTRSLTPPPPGPCWGGCTSGCGDTRGAAPTGKANAGDSPTVRGWVGVVREGGRRPLSPVGTAEGRHPTHTPHHHPPHRPGAWHSSRGPPAGASPCRSPRCGGVPRSRGGGSAPPRGRWERSRLRGGRSRHFQEDGATYGKHLELIGPAGAAPGSVVSPCGTVGTSPGRARRRPRRSPCPPPGTEPGRTGGRQTGLDRSGRRGRCCPSAPPLPPRQGPAAPGGNPRRGGSAERVPQRTERCRGGSIPSPGGVRAAPGTQTGAGGWLDMRKTGRGEGSGASGGWRGRTTEGGEGGPLRTRAER